MNAKFLINKLLASKFSKDTFWLIGAQGIVLLVGFLLNMGIEKHYGIAALGYFSQSVSFYMIFSSLFGLGLNNTVIKKISGQSNSMETKNVIFSQNLFLTMTISVVLSMIVYLLLYLVPSIFSSKELVELLSIHLIGIPFFCGNKQFAAYYTGQRKQHLFALQRLIRWGGIGLLFFAVIFMNLPMVYIISSFVLIEILLFFFNTFQNYSSIEFNLNSEVIKSSLSFGVKSYIAEIIAVFNSNVDLIILGYLLSPVDLGIYSFLIYFVKSLYIFPGIIMQNISPIISNLWGNKQLLELQKKISAVSKVNFFVAISQFLAVVGLYYFIVYFFKVSLRDSLIYFTIAGFGALIFSFVSWSGSMLIMSGKLRVNFNRTLLVLIISTINIFLFTYYFSLFGACLAVALNGLFNFLIMTVLIKKEMGIKIVL